MDITFFFSTPDKFAASLGLIGAVVGGFVGSAVGAIIPLYYAGRKSKLDRALQFFREFSSKEMSEKRNEALRFVNAHPNSSLHDSSFDDDDEAASVAVWVVARFFESLWIEVKAGSVDKKHCLEHFGFLFVWWKVRYFEKAFDEKWEIHRHFREFDMWLLVNARDEYLRWQDNAIELVTAKKFKANP